MAERAEKDPDFQPYTRDLSAFNEARENSQKWFYEWKNSLDPEEYEAIVARELAEFHTMIDNKIERRKQIKEDRERRENEEAERQSAAAEEAKAKAEAEPIAALYEQGRVHHVGTFPDLEDQMCTWTPKSSYEISPDRMDALVWAITHLVSRGLNKIWI